MDGYALIVPEPGQEDETLRLLLALADKSRHVKLNSDDPGMTFYVPEYLAEKYHNADADGEPATTADDPETPAPKRRGRPPGRKAAEAADVKDGED